MATHATTLTVRTCPAPFSRLPPPPLPGSPCSRGEHLARMRLASISGPSFCPQPHLPCAWHERGFWTQTFRLPPRRRRSVRGAHRAAYDFAPRATTPPLSRHNMAVLAACIPPPASRAVYSSGGRISERWQRHGRLLHWNACDILTVRATSPYPILRRTTAPPACLPHTPSVAWHTTRAFTKHGTAVWVLTVHSSTRRTGCFAAAGHVRCHAYHARCQPPTSHTRENTVPARGHAFRTTHAYSTWRTR